MAPTEYLAGCEMDRSEGHTWEAARKGFDSVTSVQKVAFLVIVVVEFVDGIFVCYCCYC